MYGQTSSMYKTLVDAYHTVLLRMRENNLVLPMAMIMAICGGGVVAGKAAAAPTATYTWNGGLSNGSNWDGSTVNWLNGTSPVIWPGGNTGQYAALFNAAGQIGPDNGGTVTVLPTAPSFIRPNGITFNTHGYTLSGGVITIGLNGGNDASGDGIISVSGTQANGLANVATIQSVLDGSNALAKNGNGVLLLSGANIYSGSMHVMQGVLRAGTSTVLANNLPTSGAFGVNSAVTVDASGTLSLNGFDNQISTLNGAGTVTFSNASNVGATLTVGGGNFGGSLLNASAMPDLPNTAALGTGVGKLVKNGSGTLTLSGNNTYSGATTVADGTLRSTSIAGLSANSAFTVDSGATLDVAIANTIGSLAGAGTVVLNSATLTTGRNNTSTVFSGSLTGGAASGLLKTGTGTLTLAGDNSGFAGTTTVNNGRIDIADIQSVGTGNLVAAGTTTTVTVTPTSTTTGTLPPPTTTTSTIRGELRFDIAGGGTVSNTITNATPTSTSTTTTGATSTTTTVVDTTFGTVSTSGTGTLIFSGINDYAAATHVRAGTLQAGSTSAFGGASNSQVTVDRGATLALADNSNSIGSLSGAGSVTLGNLSATQLTIADGSYDEFSGNISGAGSVKVDGGASGYSTQILSGTNSYGATFVDNGTLQIGSYSSFVNGSGRTGTLGTGIVTLGGNGTLDFERNNAITVSNTITGGGQVDVNMGPLGVLTLSGNNTYSGFTQVNSGRLDVTGSLASDVMVWDGAMLGGSGRTSGQLMVFNGAYILGVADTAQAFQALGGITGSGALILDQSGVLGAHTVNVVQLQNAAAANSALSAFSTSNYRSANLAVAGSTVTLTYTSEVRTWNAVSAVWDNMNTTAWQEGDNKFSAGDSVLFDDSGVGANGTRTVTVNGPLTPGAIHFNNSTSSYVVTGGNTGQGQIMGAASVVKDGSGTVVWDVNSNYAGTTTVNAGTFQVGNGGTQGSLGQGNVTVKQGATLLFSRGDNGLANFSDVTGDWVPSTATVTVSNVISGAGSVGQIGSNDNVVILTGNNSYTGSTTVYSGQLWAGHANAFGNNSAVTVSSGATLRTNGYDIALGSLNGGGLIQMAGNTLTVGGDNTSKVFSGQLNDVQRDADFNTSSGAALNAFNTARGITAILDANGNTVDYLGHRATVHTVITSTTGNVVTEGITYLDSAGRHMSLNDDGTIWLDSTSGIADNDPKNPDPIYRNKLWRFDNNAKIWYRVMTAPVDGAGWQTLNTADLVKVGSGTQTLSGDNTYTGMTTITDTTGANTGTLQVGNGGTSGTLGHTSAVMIGSGATLAFNRSDNALVWGADAWKNSDLYPGAGTVGAGGYTTPAPRGALVISGAISGAGTLRQAGTGTTTLTGDNSNFSGAVVVESGTLRLGDAIIDTITDLAHPEDSSRVGSFGYVASHVHNGMLPTYVDGGALGNGLGANQTVTVQNGGTLAFNFADDYIETHKITGAGNVSNTGASAVTLSAVSDYTGTTTVASTVIRYMISGPASLNNLVNPGININSIYNNRDIFGQDAVGGATFKAGAASTYDASGRVTGGAFGVQSVVTVNAGATLDLDGYSNTIGALNSSKVALTDGNARVKEYQPDAEVHAGTSSARLGTEGTAIINYYENNALRTGSELAVGLVNLNGATLTVGDGNKSGDYAGVITGGGTLVKVGTGTQILSGDSDGVSTDYYWDSSTPTAFGGDVHIDGGTLQLGNGAADALHSWSHGSLGTGHVVTASGATFAFDRIDEMTVRNQISGRGNVHQFGTGTTNLSGNNTYTGITQVDAGTLRAIGTYAFGTPDTTSAATVLNTIGQAAVNGGTLDLNDNSVHFGALGGSGGTVNLGTNATTTMTIGWFNNANDTYVGVIQGAGNVTKTGTGTQTLGGTNTYTGATNVVAGTLKAGAATVGGTSPTSGAFGVNSAMTLGGTMYGSPTTGTVDLNGFDQTIGSLATNLTTSAALANKVTNTSTGVDATLTITGTNSTAATFAGTLSDGASKKINLVKTGTGTQTLSGKFTYTGTTTVNGGKLVLDYTNMPADVPATAGPPAAPSIPSSAKGALSLSGGEVQFNNLGTRTQTFASTTITAGNNNKLTLGSGWTGSSVPPTLPTGGVNLGTLNYVSGALDVSNITTSAGWVKISGLGGQTAYTNQTFLFNGIVTANGGQNLVGTDPNGYLITAQTSDYSQGGAIVSAPAVAVRLISTGVGGNQLNRPITLAGAGTTDVTTVLNAYTAQAPGNPNRTDGQPKVVLSIGTNNILRLAAQGAIISTAGADLVIGDAVNGVGTLTANGTTTAAGVLTINAGTRSASDPINITVNSAIANNVGGAAVGVTKVGLGTLTIATAGGLAWDLNNPTSPPATGSTYTGATKIEQGTLKVGADYAMSAASQVVLNAGIFTPGAANTPGTWVSPVFDLNNHNVRIGSLADGTLPSSGVTGATVALGTGGLTLGEDGTNAIFSGVITSGATSNGLTKVGAGTQTLAGNNTFSGPVTIYDGTLQLGNGGASGTLGSGFSSVNTGTATTHGTLAFNRGDATPVVFGNSIFGAGGIAQNGAATVVLTGGNTYTGATVVTGGTLQAGVATVLSGNNPTSGAFGVNSAVTVDSGATLALNNFNSSIGSLAGGGGVTLGAATLTTGGDNTSKAFSGSIVGSGGLTKVGTGTQTLSGINGYTGATTVTAGTLAVDCSGGSHIINSSSDLVLQGGSLVFQALGATAQTFASTTVTSSTPFVISQTGWTSGVVDLGTLGGATGLGSWSGNLDIQNLSVTPSWIKTSDSRYASKLNWSGKAASSTQRVATDSDGYFILVTTTDYSQGGAIGDSAGPSFASTDVVRLVSTGFGGNVANASITLSDDLGTDPSVSGISNDYAAGTANPTANTSVTLNIGAGKTLHVGAFGIGNAPTAGTDLRVSGGKLTSSVASLGFTADGRKITVDSQIVGNIGITQNSGTTILIDADGSATANNYTGVTTVRDGTLQVGNGGATAGNLGSGEVKFIGGTLAFDRGNAATLGNVLTSLSNGAGTVAQNGSSTLTITNASGFTGALAVNSSEMDFNSSTILAGASSIASGATLSIGGNSTVSFVNMANNGTLRITSGSSMTLSNTVTSTGLGTIANAGTLTLNAGSTTTNAVVNDGRMTVTGGTVTTGDLTFNSGSVLTLANLSTTIVSSGAVTVNSGSKLTITDTTGFATLLGAPKKIIDGTSATGMFQITNAAPISTVPGASLYWVNLNEGGDLYLGTQYKLVKPRGTNPQEKSIVDALTTAGAQRVVDSEIQGAITTLAGQTGGTFRNTVDSLSGHDRSAIDAHTLQHATSRGQNLLQFAQMQLVNDETVVSLSTQQAMRATCLNDLQAGALEDSYGLQFFLHADQVNESRDQQGNGVSATDATGNTFTVGVHNQLSDDINIGMAFTYDQADITTGNGLGTTDATTYGVDLYFSSLCDESQRWFIAGDLGFGKSNYDTKRSGIMPGNLTATGSASGTQFHVAGEIGYHADLWQDAMLTPYAGLSYVRNTVGSYAESLPGAPGLALAYDEHTATATEAVVGANFAQGIHLSGGYMITPSFGVAAHRQLGNTDATAVSTHFAGASNTTFNTYLGSPARNAVEIQGAVSLQIPGGLKVFVDARHYESVRSVKISQDRIGAGLRYDF